VAAHEPMGMEELLALPVSIDLRTAARALRIGKNKAYEQATAGTFPIPVRRSGAEWRCNRADLFRELGLDPATVAAPVKANAA
jgi:hypothetical protein